MVVGCICEADDGRILMCRRAINPRHGFWTFPSGFLECGESAAEGACREAREEAQAQVQIEGLLCVIDVPQISEMHLVYRARLQSVRYTPTHESAEVVLLDESEIPWDRLAFSSVEVSLRCYFEDRAQARAGIHLVDLR
jgi:ADP-ribose pyrophosphatase YjhB (NUDIX family)